MCEFKLKILPEKNFHEERKKNAPRFLRKRSYVNVFLVVQTVHQSLSSIFCQLLIKMEGEKAGFPYVHAWITCMCSG